MIKTSEEIILAVVKRNIYDDLEDFFNECPLSKKKRLIAEMVNDARKEAIEECAERAKAFISVNDEPKVGKQSILSLIDELK